VSEFSTAATVPTQFFFFKSSVPTSPEMHKMAKASIKKFAELFHFSILYDKYDINKVATLYA
jgi:hypothetical protein